MNALRIPRSDRDRLVERLQGIRMPPIDPATVTGLDVIDGTGIQRGNADIAGSCAWTPTAVTPGTAPLPIYPNPADKEPTA